MPLPISIIPDTPSLNPVRSTRNRDVFPDEEKKPPTPDVCPVSSESASTIVMDTIDPKVEADAEGEASGVGKPNEVLGYGREDDILSPSESIRDESKQEPTDEVVNVVLDEHSAKDLMKLHTLKELKEMYVRKDLPLPIPLKKSELAEAIAKVRPC